MIIVRRQQRLDVAVSCVGARLPRVRARAADFFVTVLHIARRQIFDLPRIAMKMQISRFEGDRRETYRRTLRSAIDQDRVPVDLQVRRDADSLRAYRQLAREISVSWCAAILREIPCLRRHASTSLLHSGLRRRARLALMPGLVGGVHSSGGEVFDLAVEQQT